MLFPREHCRFHKWERYIGRVVSPEIADALKNRGILSGKIAPPNRRGKPQIAEETEPEPSRQGGCAKVSSARKVLNIQYSQARGERADSRRRETDGYGCTGQFHFSYFLLFRVLLVGARRREGEREKGWSDIFYRRCVWHSARLHHIPLSSRSRGGGSRAPHKSSCEGFRGATQEG